MDSSRSWPWPDTNAVCSCGELNCRELGWTHEWDPVDCGDSCILLCNEPLGIDSSYVRWGSGYAHVACAEGEEATHA